MLKWLTDFIAANLPFDAVAQELAAGALGAAFLGLVGLLWRYAHWIYLAAKYPVGGRFTNWFEDIENRVSVTRTGSSTLRQRGLTVVGKTRLATGRTWTLRGNIIDRRHVVGVYTADDPADQGVGSFYLVLANGDLEGVWTGYDHINQRTTTGRYSFKRLRRIRIKRYQPKYSAAVVDILAATFGQGYSSDIDKAAGQDNAIAYMALERQRVRGFGYAYLAKTKSLATITKKNPGVRSVPALDDADAKGTLGVIQTIAVAPDAQGRGVGTQMLASLEAYLWRRGSTAIIVPGWRRQTGVSVRGLLESAGYSEWGTVERYWSEGCDSGQFQCPDRASTCACDVTFYRKTSAR